jgi:hypothetical protein
MPYFKKENVNVLFIHIPKTGGTSIDNYLSKKYDIELRSNPRVLYGRPKVAIERKNKPDIWYSLQHMLYTDIMGEEKLFQIDRRNLVVFAVVRNPYHRIISDLFFWGLMKENNTQDETYALLLKTIQSNIEKTNKDNHITPPYKFVTDENGILIHGITIMHTETLDADMHNFGYTDFNLKYNTNTIEVDYMDYLNQESIDLINQYYSKDFEMFGYEKI